MTTLSACCHLLPNRGTLGAGTAAESSKCSAPVLKFVCCWEQQKRTLDDKATPVLLLYHTSDNTMELQQLPIHCKPAEALHSDISPSFRVVVKRQRVAKPSYQSPVKVALSGGLRPCRPVEGFYHWRDIVVGRPLPIYGFNLLVCHSAQETAEFYRSSGSTAITSQASPDMTAISGTCPATSLTQTGSTLATNFLNYTGRGTGALRFRASMVDAPNFECKQIDTNRQFVLTFYLEDGTIAIAEPPNKETNTGGEQFFARQHATKPCLHRPYTPAGPYRVTDLFLGALVPVLLKARRGFEAEGPKMLQLLFADDWTLDYMASRPQDWPCADPEQVLARLREEVASAEGRDAAVARLLAEDCSKTPVDQQQSLCVMLTTAGCKVTLHECVTLLRYLGGPHACTDAATLAETLHLPEPEQESPTQRAATLHPQTVRPGASVALTSRLATAAVRSLPARPQSATEALSSVPQKTRSSGKEATSYGSDFRFTGRQTHRIGCHVFGNDAFNDPYYNTTEHGTHLIREAINQKSGKAPSWAS